MADEDERRSAQNQGLPPSGTVVPTSAVDPGEGRSVEATGPVPTAGGPETLAARSDEPFDAVDASAGRVEAGPGTDKATDAFSSSDVDLRTAPGSVADPARAGTDARSGGLAALVGIVLVLLIAAVSYLFYDRLNRTEPDLQPTLADLGRRVAELEARPVPAAPDQSALSHRIDAEDQQVAALKQVIGQVQSQLAALDKQAAVAAPAAGDTGLQIKDLQDRVATVDRGLGELKTALMNLPKPDFGAIDARVDQVDQHVAAVQKGLDDLPRVDLGPLTARVDGLEQRLKPIESQVEAASAPGRVAQTRAAPLAVTAEAIRRAIDAGRPFPADLDALRRLGTDPKLIEPLQAVANDGAPTLSDLRGDLAALSDGIIKAGRPAPSGSYLDRILSGAGSLVSVRPLGTAVGDTPGAIVARIDSDLASDDLTAALSEWQKLPEPARAASKRLGDRMRLRLAAEEAARTVGADAIQAMTAAKP